MCRGGAYTSAWEAYFRVKRRFRLSGAQYINTSGFRLVGDVENAYYEVSGSIKDAGGNPVAGAKIKGIEQEIQTDASGLFSMLLPEGWSGTISPELTGKKFDPVAYPISNLNEEKNNLNFTASDIVIGNFGISGVVTDQNGDPVSAVRLTGLDTEVLTDDEGKFYAEVSPGWTGKIVPTLEDYVFSPLEREYAQVQDHQTLQNFTAGYIGNYLVSGKILDLAGRPIESVNLIGFPNETITDGSGYYQTEVPAGWTGTITPVKEGFHFAPDELAFLDVRQDMSEQNFLSDLISGIGREQHGINIFPNPTSGGVEIALEQKIKLSGKVNVFNLQGQLIKILDLKVGTRGTMWEGKDGKGNSIPAGVYLCQVFVDEKMVAKVKIVVMK